MLTRDARNSEPKNEPMPDADPNNHINPGPTFRTSLAMTGITCIMGNSKRFKIKVIRMIASSTL